jgi:hypothetical protein
MTAEIRDWPLAFGASSLLEHRYVAAANRCPVWSA